jgi:hypothetical protein
MKHNKKTIFRYIRSKFSSDSATLHSVGIFSNYLETAAGHLFALGEDRMLGHYLHSGSVFLENVAF